MTRKIAYLLIILCLGFSANTFAQSKNQIDPAFLKYQKPGGALPELQIKTTNSKTVTNKDLKTKHHLFLIVFNPTCSHCIKVSKMIADNAALFKNNKVVFMAQDAMASYLPDYEKKTGVNQHPAFIVGVDKIYAIDKLANYKLLPMINIYDKNQKLVKTFNGDTPLDSLKNYLH